MARYSLALLLLLFHHTLLHAQNRTVSGHVVNEETKEAMPGVTVSLKGTSQSVVTDAKGYFAINPPADMKLVTLTFSSVGFNSREMKLTNDGPVTVPMSINHKSMDDVIVVGYGTQKRSNVLGSVSVVTGKELEDIPAINMSTSLINTVPGVSVSQTSGKPGATTNLTIRGATTFSASGTTNPLYVIDGLVPIISASGNVDPSGRTAFDLLDPSEIESITFLKDASATIYGARGANGVVLVTTKRGRPGRPRISYSGSYIYENAAKVPKMIDGPDQMALLNNWVQNYTTDPTKFHPTELYTQAEMDSVRYRTHNGRDMWFNQVWNPGYATRHNVSVSGGSDRITVFAGVNYYNEIGNLPNDTHQKYGIQLGANAKVTDDLTMDITLGYDNGFNNQPVPKGITTTDQADQENGYVGSLLQTPSFVPETVGGLPVYYSPTKFNPIAFNNSGSYEKDNSETFNINFAATYKIPFIKGLSVHGQYGRNTYNDFSKQWFVPYNAYNLYSPGAHTNKNGASANTPPSTQNVIFQDSVTSVQHITNSDQLAELYNNSKNWQATEGIQYANIWGKNNLDVSVYAEQQQTIGQYLTTYRQTAIIPGVDQYYAYSATTTNWYDYGYQTSTGRASYLGRLSYTYDDKYMLQAAFRDDASPNFPIKNQWGFFPSVSVGWLASNEDWWSRSFFSGLNDFKVRLNVGLTGNDATSSFSWSQVYTASNPIGYLFGSTGQYGANGLQTTLIPNPEITWERALFKDLGFDGTFANRKFHYSVDLWYKHQYDMLESPTATVPNTFGGKIADVNHGILNSWGDEIQIGYNGHINKDWSIFATVNMGISIAGNNKVISKFYSAGTDTGYKYPIGKPTDLGISGYKSTGIVRTQDQVNAWYAKHPGWTINGDSLRPGDLNFVDVNGDGIIDGNDVTQIAKHSNSIMGIGYLLGAQWKSIRISTNIAMTLGGKRVLSKVDITPPTKDAAGLDMWRGSYTAWNPNAPLPAIYAPNANQASTFWLRSSTALYVNNLQLSWTLPQSFLGKYKIPDARLYLTGMNLWTIINPTPYKDPRSGEITDYPILRTWTFGLNVNL